MSNICVDGTASYCYAYATNPPNHAPRLLSPSSCRKGTDSRGTPSPPSQRPRRGDGNRRQSGPWVMAHPNFWFKQSLNAGSKGVGGYLSTDCRVDGGWTYGLCEGSVPLRMGDNQLFSIFFHTVSRASFFPGGASPRLRHHLEYARITPLALTVTHTNEL